MTGAPLVGFGQVDVFEVYNHPLAVLRSQDSPGVGGHGEAELREVLQDVLGRGLRTAVDGGDLCGVETVETPPQ